MGTDGSTLASDDDEESLLRVAQYGSDYDQYKLAGTPVLPLSVVRVLGRANDPMVRVRLLSSAGARPASAVREFELHETDASVLHFLARQFFASAVMKQTARFGDLSPESIELALEELELTEAVRSRIIAEWFANNRSESPTDELFGQVLRRAM
jgi:hypothetical protein